MHPIATIPSLQSLQHMLQDLQLVMTASEMHGFISGLLAAGVRLNKLQLIKLLEAHTETNQAFDDALIASVWQIQLATLEALGASEIIFTPLLPNDDYTLAERVTALADWCQGLLAGFGLAIRGDDARLHKGDIQETLQDLVNIVHVGGDFNVETEEDEKSYMELYEFVRFATVHLFEEMSPTEEHRPQHEQLH
jgi:yecA family protein